MYQLMNNFDGILRIEDLAWIPNDPNNYDWRQYQEWLKKGNLPQEIQGSADVLLTK